MKICIFALNVDFKYRGTKNNADKIQFEIEKLLNFIANCIISTYDK